MIKSFLLKQYKYVNKVRVKNYIESLRGLYKRKRVTCQHIKGVNDMNGENFLNNTN